MLNLCVSDSYLSFHNLLFSADKATKGDLIHSLLETVCENIGQLATQIARSQGVPRVYFVGNFVNTPKAQQFITRTMKLKQFQPVGQSVVVLGSTKYK